MSQVRDTFYHLLAQKVEDKNYNLKKATGNFEKKAGHFKYIIQFSWDGRGGHTYLNGLIGVVKHDQIEKLTKNFLAYKIPIMVIQHKNQWVENKYPITQMYSQKLIDLAKGMKFKEMSALSFEEKYPMDKIVKTVEVVAAYINNEVIPFHDFYQEESQILEEYIELAKEKFEQNDLCNISNYIFPIKLLCKKMKIEEPNFVKKINLFTNQSMDECWNIQSHDFDNLEQKFNELKF